MKKPIISLTILIIVLGCGKAYCQVYFDWWGTQKVDMVVIVRSADTREPIPGATVRLTDLKEPNSRESADSVQEQTTTDESGTAVLQPEFDASGGVTLLFRSYGWQLSGKLEIEKEGYRPVRDRIVNYTGRISYPMSVRRIEVEAFLRSGSDGTPALLVPIGFDPYRGGYLFNGKLYQGDILDTGFGSIADAIAASGSTDKQLQQYINDYYFRLAFCRGLFWSGAALVLGAAAVDIYFTTKDKERTLNSTGHYIRLGVMVAGGVAVFIGMLAPGAPTGLVDYYNKTNR
jgi:hypothetical protein